MIINQRSMLLHRPIKNMLSTKERAHGVSHGLSEAGYDIRIKQEILFWQRLYPSGYHRDILIDGKFAGNGRFIIASAIEEFDMPDNLVGIVHDKSTWARQGLSVFNTVIEPGWQGFLTLELVYHGEGDLYIPAGAGIAQVVFSMTSDKIEYAGKYQNQADEPVGAIAS